MRPAVATDGLGNFVVAWQAQARDGSASRVLIRRFARDGAPLGAAQVRPAVARGPGGREVVVWQSAGQDGDGWGVFGQVYSVPGLALFTVTPCRVVDTREPAGPLGGPALGSGAVRIFPVTSGSCGVPATAKALSLNVTVVGEAGGGNVTLYPGDLSGVATSTINFRAGQVRANNAVLALSRDGQATLAAVAALGGGGQVHLIVDVNGYFQ